MYVDEQRGLNGHCCTCCTLVKRKYPPVIWKSQQWNQLYFLYTAYVWNDHFQKNYSGKEAKKEEHPNKIPDACVLGAKALQPDFNESNSYMAAFVQLEKQCCQPKDAGSIQRHNNAYKGTSNCSRARLWVWSVFARPLHESLSSPFIKGHNKAVSQCVSQLGRSPRL